MEDSFCELKFNESLFTTVLKSFSVFLSAFPGFIVFGKTFTTSYPQNCYFKFSPFELYKLYIAIIQILNYFIEDTPKITRGIILERNETTRSVYFWNSTSLIINEKEEKVIFFGIENEDGIILKIKMSLPELHNFINALKSVISLSLCLTTLQNELIITASSLEISTLKKLKNYGDAKSFVEKFIQLNNIQTDEVFKFIQIIHYYFDIIVLIHKFSTMCQFEENICDQILSAT
jgi:hypothetical protein